MLKFIIKLFLILNVNSLIVNNNLLKIRNKNNNILMSEYKYENEYYNFLLNYKQNNKLLLSNSLSKNNFIKNRQENYKIFENNLDLINEFNNKNNSFKLEINKFSDKIDFKNTLSSNDLMNKKIKKFNIFSNFFLIFKKKFYKKKIIITNSDKKFIWNDTILSNVKNQENCGSCWAFSSTGAIESYMRINNYSINRLSEQELIDCSDKNYGCNGGIMHEAFEYCIDNKGLASNDDYPYIGCYQECGYCNFNFTKVNGSDIKDYNFIIPTSIKDIKESLRNGPIAIALDANQFIFRFYKYGIIDLVNNDNMELNHAVLLTGHDYDENGEYWIIQNSWGEDWGDNGYAKLRIKKGDGTLLCQLYGVYPI